MRRFVCCALGVFCVLVFPASAALAQVGGGQITGIVIDNGGAAVRHATVTAIHLATGMTRSVVSSDAGVYTLAGLVPGGYRLDINLQGFKPIHRGGIRLETGDTLRLDIALEV